MVRDWWIKQGKDVKRLQSNCKAVGKTFKSALPLYCGGLVQVRELVR
jgi:hypothetical protein